jgi:hypothetical protein
VRLGYADPPYFGCGKLYADQHTEALVWDNPDTHAQLVTYLQNNFDGWVIHASATPESMALYGPLVLNTGARWGSWRKGFAAFKKNVSVAYAWEPVIIKKCRKPVVNGRLVMRDWVEADDIKCSITLKRGLTGAKPEAVVHWALELMGARPEDELLDIFPGTGAVTEAWGTWRDKFTLPIAEE